MDVELLHKSVNAVPAVMRMVQAVDPVGHTSVVKNVVKSFIILLD